MTKAFKDGRFIDYLMLLVKEYVDSCEKGMKGGDYVVYSIAFSHLIDLFDKNEDDLLEEYHKYYGTAPLSDKRAIQLARYYAELNIYAYQFTEQLDFKLVLLCRKAQLFIASVCGLGFEKKWPVYMELMEQYGRLYDYEQYIHWCNKALEEAHESGDKPMVFVFLARKWAQCFFGALRDPDLDFSSYYMNTAEKLLKMLAQYQDDSEKLKQAMEDMEMRKLEDEGLSYKDDYLTKLNLIEQAYEVFMAFLAYDKGDEKEFNERKERLGVLSEDCMDRDDIEQAFAVNNYLQGDNSDKNNQALYRGDKKNATPETVIPKGLLRAGRFLFLAFYSRKLLDDKAKETAKIHYEELEQMVGNDPDPFLRAVLTHCKSRFTQEVNPNEAIKEKTEALELMEVAERFGCHFATTYFFFYSLYTERGNLYSEESPELAIDDFTKAKENLEKMSMGQSMRMSELLLWRGCMHYRLDHKEESEKDIAEAFSIIIEDGRHRIPLMDTDTIELFWAKASKALRRAMAFVEPDDSPYLLTAAYNTVLFSKGLLLSSEQTVKRVIETDERFAHLRKIYEELQDAPNGVPQIKGTEYLNGIDHSANYIKNLRLAQELNEVIKKQCSYLYYSLDNVKAALKESQVLVDFFDYELEDGDQQYLAFVVRRNSEAPVMVRLCKESALAAVIDQAKAHDSYFDTYDTQQPFAHQLTALLWNPIRDAAQLKPEDEVFIVPSGSLARIPIESLPAQEDSNVVLADYYKQFVRLSHARALSTSDDSKLDSIALFGGMNYGAGENDFEDESDERGSFAGLEPEAPRRLTPWHHLDGTGAEVATIAYRMRKAKKEVHEYVAEEATVEAFKALSGNGPDIIHISTHGFFETPLSAVNLPALKRNDPMSLSGLVFANGNEGWLHGTPQNHEGIVTAAEIAKMQLDAKLVVMSACHSGNGEVLSDGIYGLQRGFKKAGVQSMVISLWTLKDEEGREFMTAFYSRLIAGVPRRQAFREARHKLMEEYPYTPKKWAGLIMLD